MKCFKCQKFHHTSLHMVTSVQKTAAVTKENTPVNSLHINDSEQASVLLATALLKVKTDNNFVTLRALIYPGSQASVIS